jgi:ATP-dependent DNA helicase RecG
MKAHEILELIANGENSGVEFKLDDIRPERLAKEAVGMANLHGGRILLGVDDHGRIAGVTRRNLEEWVMDTVFGRYVHPAIIPHYEETQFPDGKRVAVISLSAGAAKPYVVRHNNREDIFVRMGSTTRPATREKALRLFGAGGLFYTETLPVSGTSLKSMDRVRLENYLGDILGEPSLPEDDDTWVERLTGLGFLTDDSPGRTVCTVAGLVLFGIRPRTRLPQSGLRVTVFDAPDKQYQALLDVTLDAPMVGRRLAVKGSVEVTIDDGLVEKFVHAV